MVQIDIDMPKNCEECPLCHRAFDGNETRLSCYGLGAWCFEDDGRLENCPLHEVTDTDTVSRKQAIDAVVKLMPTEDGKYNMWDVFGVLKGLPPSPSRPKGRWIKHHEITDGNDIATGYMCSQCKRVVEVHSWETLINKYPYCNCGAEMRGAEHE